MTHKGNLGCALCSTHSTCNVRLSHTTPQPRHIKPLPTDSLQKEIIHIVSDRGTGVLYQPERSTACLLSLATELIQRSSILQLIGEENISARCTRTSSCTSVPPSTNSVTEESYTYKCKFSAHISIYEVHTA